MEKVAGASFSNSENAIIKFVEDNESFIKLNFLGVIKEIYGRMKSSESIDGPIILEHLYKEYLGPLIAVIREYYSSTKLRYYKIIIIADNLDKAWNIKKELNIQSEMILSLMEIENKILSDLMSKKDEVTIKQIVLLRKDIFDYIIKNSAEPDKIISLAHEIDWESYPILLKQLIEDRFRYIFKREKGDNVEDIWNEFFDLKDPFKEIEEIVTKRPRDVIYFITRLFESAINNNHGKVSTSDYEKAIDEYSNFINNSLITETNAEYPEINQILSKLQKHFGQIVEYKIFKSIIESSGVRKDRIERLIEALFAKGYLLGFDEKEGKPFSDLEILKEKLKKRRFIFLPNKVFLIAHAKYWFIKNKKSAAF